MLYASSPLVLSILTYIECLVNEVEVEVAPG